MILYPVNNDGLFNYGNNNNQPVNLKNCNCKRYSIPIARLSSIGYMDMQFYSNSNPTSFNAYLLEEYTTTQIPVNILDYTSSTRPNGRWYTNIYGIAINGTSTKKCFTFIVEATINGSVQKFQSPNYVIEDCINEIRMETCQTIVTSTNPTSSFNNNTDNMGIYYGLPINGAVVYGNPNRYFHNFLLLRNVTQKVSSYKMSIEKVNNRAIKTKNEKIVTVTIADEMPDWFIDNILNLLSTGRVNIIEISNNLIANNFIIDDVTVTPVDSCCGTFSLSFTAVETKSKVLTCEYCVEL
jgi:predicted regulator of amino acid metabolism with ACT domain